MWQLNSMHVLLEKKTIYAMCYGMERWRLKGRAAYWLACEGLDKRLFADLQREPSLKPYYKLGTSKWRELSSKAAP